MDLDLHSDKGLIHMHLRMLQMVTEALSAQMVNRSNTTVFAEGLISHVQNLLWFASLSISELQVEMVEYIRKRHASGLFEIAIPDEDGSVFGAYDAVPPLPKGPVPTPPGRKSTPIPARDEKLHPQSRSGTPYRSSSLITPKRKKQSRKDRQRSSASFDSGALPQNREHIGLQVVRTGSRKRDGHRRMSMGGGGGQNEMGSFQVLFPLRFKQLRNEDKSGVQRKELDVLVKRHCTWILSSVELPFRKMVQRFVQDMKSKRSIGSTATTRPWGQTADDGMGIEDIKKRNLRESLLQVSEFVSTLADTIWNMHLALQQRRDPGPMRELFIPVCIKAIWPVVLRDLEPIILSWYRDVYKETTEDLLAYWARVQKAADEKAPQIVEKRKSLEERVAVLTKVLNSEAFIGVKLKDKIGALLNLIKTVPLVVPKERDASADSLLSLLAFCMLSKPPPEVCAQVHFLADMVMMVHPDDSLGQLGCSVTSLVCAAQYSAGLEPEDYIELVETLYEDTTISRPSTIVESQSQSQGSSASVPNNGADKHQLDTSRSTSRDLSASITVGSQTRDVVVAPPDLQRDSTEEGLAATLTPTEKTSRLEYWQGDISDLLALCQYAAKYAGKKTRSGRRVFVARTLARKLFLSRIADSADDAVNLARTLEAYGVIRMHNKDAVKENITSSKKRTRRRSKKDEIEDMKRASQPDLKAAAAKLTEAQRIEVMNMVKQGKMTVDEAMESVLRQSETALDFEPDKTLWEVAGRFGDAGVGGAVLSQKIKTTNMPSHQV